MMWVFFCIDFLIYPFLASVSLAGFVCSLNIRGFIFHYYLPEPFCGIFVWEVSLISVTQDQHIQGQKSNQIDCLIKGNRTVFFLSSQSSTWSLAVAEIRCVLWEAEVLSWGNYKRNEKEAYFTKQNRNASNYVSARMNNIFNFQKLWQAVMGEKLKLQLLFQDSKSHDRNEVSVCCISNLFVHLWHCSTNRLAASYSRLQFVMSDSLVFSSNWRNGLLQAVSVRHQLTHIDEAQLAPRESIFQKYNELHRER